MHALDLICSSSVADTTPMHCFIDRLLFCSDLFFCDRWQLCMYPSCLRIHCWFFECLFALNSRICVLFKAHSHFCVCIYSVGLDQRRYFKIYLIFWELVPFHIVEIVLSTNSYVPHEVSFVHSHTRHMFHLKDNGFSSSQVRNVHYIVSEFSWNGSSTMYQHVFKNHMMKCLESCLMYIHISNMWFTTMKQLIVPRIVVGPSCNWSTLRIFCDTFSVAR